MIFALALAAALPWHEVQPKYFQPSERDEFEWIMKRLGWPCSAYDEKCANGLPNTIYEAVDASRDLQFGRNKLLAYMAIEVCRKKIEPFIVWQYAECLRGFETENNGQLLDLLDIQPVGVNLSGYRSLQSGMPIEMVERIMGEDGEEISSSSYGTESASMVQWESPRCRIIVSFSNSTMTGKSQMCR